MSTTKLLYLEDSYLKTAPAKITSVSTQGGQTAIILNRTIFYPQGGGQPSDMGTITGKSGTLTVTQVSYNHGSPLHSGKLDGTLKKGNPVTLALDWNRRFYNMRLHSAGHVVHEAIMEVAYGIEPVSGMHGIGGKLFIKYKGVIDRTLLPQIQAKTDAIIMANKAISTKLVSLEELKAQASWVPDNLPQDKPLRIIQIQGFGPIPDGGTQVKSTSEIGPIQITDIDYEDGHSLIHYRLSSPLQASRGPTPSYLESITLNSFEGAVVDLEKQALSEINTSTPKQTHQLKLKYLGKRGQINALTKQIPRLPQEARGLAGQKLNLLKQKLESAFSQEPKAKSQKPTFFDPTLPSLKPTLGHLHPITKIFHEVEDIFLRFGFTIATGPEIEWDEINFQKLLLGPDHPSRDTQETYYFDAKRLLRVHTSSVQIRYMESHQPPIRIISPGRVYRRDQIDATHLPSFHQIEGLMVDAHTTLTDLLGMLEHTVKQLFGAERKVRFYGHHFPYTEPSLEVEAQTQTGEWLEIIGCGMVHPQVLKNCGIDSHKYQGWAFGMGPDRLAMLKYSISDIRSLYSGDLRFLNL